MNNTIKNIQRTSYHTPELTLILLDSEISLILQSLNQQPPEGPGEEKEINPLEVSPVWQ